MSRLQHFFILFWLLIFLIEAGKTIGQETKPRLIITADPELDDNNSLIRLILYSTDFTIEGLIYSSSQFHWAGDGKGTKWYVAGREYDRFNIGGPYESWRWHKGERFIHNIVEAYEKVYPNLKIHHQDYPLPSVLKSKVKYGNVHFDGDVSKDTEGSVLIKKLILDNKPGKLFITAWGGHSTIARALISIKKEFEYSLEWDNLKRKISSKVVLLPSGDQDDTYTLYIKPHWPDIEYRQFTLGPNYGYGAQLNAIEVNKPFLTPEWMKTNVTDQGPLGALYRVWGDGRQMVKNDVVDYFGLEGYNDDELRKMGYKVWMPVQQKGSWLGEGDNHTFMNMLANGLRAYEQGSYGGWGGVSLPGEDDILYLEVDSSDHAMAERITSIGNRNNDFPNFFPEAQNDFAARLKWSVTNSFHESNHPPMVKIQGPALMLVNPGQTIKVFSNVSDPDRDQVVYKWWQCKVGSMDKTIEIQGINSANTEVKIPADVKSGETIHLILEVKDNGKPVLTSYRRMIMQVR